MLPMGSVGIGMRGVYKSSTALSKVTRALSWPACLLDRGIPIPSVRNELRAA